MNEPILSVRFYRTEADSEPVREWLKKLSARDRKTVGEDIKTVQFGWPLGMPLVRKMGKDVWEVRCHLEDRIARILFTVDAGVMVLLHGFVKKARTEPGEIALGRQRQKALTEQARKSSRRRLS